MSEFTRVVIAGNRTATSEQVYEYVKYHLDMLFDRQLFGPKDKVTIVSGGADGIDTMAVRYAIEKEIAYDIVPADWVKYKRRAGPIRNEKMAESSDALIAFWDGESTGTENMIQMAAKYNLPTLFYQLNPQPEEGDEELLHDWV